MTDLPAPPVSEYRVTAPFRGPRYFKWRYLAYDYAYHTPESVTHVRIIHPNGSTGPWQLLENK